MMPLIQLLPKGCLVFIRRIAKCWTEPWRRNLWESPKSNRSVLISARGWKSSRRWLRLTDRILSRRKQTVGHLCHELLCLIDFVACGIPIFILEDTVAQYALKHAHQRGAYKLGWIL